MLSVNIRRKWKVNWVQLLQRLKNPKVRVLNNKWPGDIEACFLIEAIFLFHLAYEMVCMWSSFLSKLHCLKLCYLFFRCELRVSCKHLCRFKTEERLTNNSTYQWVLYAPRTSIIFSQEINVFRLVLSHKRISMRSFKNLCAGSSLCDLAYLLTSSHSRDQVVAPV